VAANTIATMRMFAGELRRRGSPTANGQVLSIGQNTALFSLLGTQLRRRTA
jgi:microcystin-dependent protein